MRKTVLALALALVASLAFTAVADAHTLSIKRAKKETLEEAKRECAQFPGCTEVSAGPCRRLSAHKVRCHAGARSAETVCRWLVTVRRVRGSSRVRVNSNPEQTAECTPR